MNERPSPHTLEIDVAAERLEDALGAALESIVAAAQGGGLIAERGSLSLPFKGEGADIPVLLVELTASLLEAIEGQREAVSALSVAGVLTTERGYSAWGFATVARGTPVKLRRVDLSAPVLVYRHGRRVEINTTAVVGD